MIPEQTEAVRDMIAGSATIRELVEIAHERCERLLDALTLPVPSDHRAEALAYQLRALLTAAQREADLLNGSAEELGGLVNPEETR